MSSHKFGHCSAGLHTSTSQRYHVAVLASQRRLFLSFYLAPIIYFIPFGAPSTNSLHPPARLSPCLFHLRHLISAKSDRFSISCFGCFSRKTQIWSSQKMMWKEKSKFVSNLKRSMKPLDYIKVKPLLPWSCFFILLLFIYLLFYFILYYYFHFFFFIVFILFHFIYCSGEQEYRELDETAEAHIKTASLPGALVRDFDPLVLRFLYSRGLVYLHVPISPDDRLSIPPLEVGE